MKCIACGCSDTKKNPVTEDPDPFQSEINDDETIVWECDECRYDSAMAIQEIKMQFLKDMWTVY